MKLKNDLFLSSYFALLAGFAHASTTNHWSSISQNGLLSWEIVSLIMIFFFSSHFAAALFPQTAMIRLTSFFSLVLFLKTANMIESNSWGQFAFIICHFVVCVAPFKLTVILSRWTHRIDRNSFKFLGLLSFIILSFLFVQNRINYPHWLFAFISVSSFFLIFFANEGGCDDEPY